MTTFEFLEELCNIIGGDGAWHRYSKDELITMCKEMSTSHEEYTNLMECKDAREVHDLMNPQLFT